MRLAVAADHAGFALKEHLRAVLAALGHEVVDHGVFTATRSDYPDQAAAVGRAVARGDAERGLLVCGSGIGMAIAANKIRGVRAAVGNDLYGARLAREHNDANVLTLGARVIGVDLAEAVLHVFLDTPFSGGRHAARVDKITALEP